VVDVRAGDVDRVRVGELGLVPVAGREPHHDLVALVDLLAAELDVAGRRTPD
jgi:hypothetical protein